jgi:hypothetical protein
MTFNPRGLLVTAAFGVVLWAAAELRWAIFALAATAWFDVMQLAGKGVASRR